MYYKPFAASSAISRRFFQSILRPCVNGATRN